VSAPSDLAGSTAVVTGAASGIGRALVRCFAAEGMGVVAADVDLEGAQTTVEGLDDALAVGCDVADADAVEALAAASYERFGAVHVLCNNAGVFQAGLSWEVDPADWRWCLDVNVWGIIHAYRAFVPRMLQGGAWGHVVNTASVAAFVASPMSGPYTMTKMAALSLSETLAREMQALDTPIGVSVLTPSAVATRIAESERNRPSASVVEQTPTAIAVTQGLAQMTGAGLDPDEVAARVLEGIRAGDFLIPTRPSYAEQLRVRHEALVERRVPGDVVVD
jgi:NAD(P)-dependent dehydrogenase (short-subunit alcohol dehydrogenase family)